MRVETYYCDVCKKDVGNNENKLYCLSMEVPFAWSSKRKRYYICSDCIKKVEKLLDNMEQGVE